MHFLKCEECGKEVNPVSGRCPYCGCPFSKTKESADSALFSNNDIHNTMLPLPPHPKKRAWLKCTVVLLIVIILFTVFNISDIFMPNEAISTIEELCEERDYYGISQVLSEIDLSNKKTKERIVDILYSSVDRYKIETIDDYANLTTTRAWDEIYSFARLLENNNLTAENRAFSYIVELKKLDKYNVELAAIMWMMSSDYAKWQGIPTFIQVGDYSYVINAWSNYSFSNYYQASLIKKLDRKKADAIDCFIELERLANGHDQYAFDRAATAAKLAMNDMMEVEIDILYLKEELNAAILDLPLY